MGHLSFYLRMGPFLKMRMNSQVGVMACLAIHACISLYVNIFMSYCFAEGDEIRDAVLVTDGDSEMGQVRLLLLLIKSN